VTFVERRYGPSSPEEKLEAARPWVEKFREAGADGIVLGCTHFLLLLEEFRRAAKEASSGLEIFDSVRGVSRRVEALLDGEGGARRAPHGSQGGRPLLVMTGTAQIEPYWTALAEKFDLDLGLLE
jgi:glutamate racemase